MSARAIDLLDTLDQRIAEWIAECPLHLLPGDLDRLNEVIEEARGDA